jgi:hypothetical protein
MQFLWIVCGAPRPLVNGTRSCTPVTFSMWSFKGMCRKAMPLVNTMGHVNVYDLCGVDIGGECQDGYDGKIKR